MIDPHHDVTLGGLALMQDGKPVPSVDGYTLKVLGAETDFGNPQPVSTTLYSMLRDGSIVARDRDENRQPVLLVEVQADLNDGNALALGEAALMAVCRRPVELVWRPPQAGAEPVVFDVVDSNVEHAFDDVNELLFRRTFRVTMSALPHGRRSLETVVSAVTVPAVPTTVTVDACDSATGWSGTPTVSQASGYVQTSAGSEPVGTPIPKHLERAGTIDFSATPYLVVEWQVTATLGGVTLLTLDQGPKVATSVLSDGWLRSHFRMPVSVDKLTFRAEAQHYAAGGSSTIRVRDVKRTDTPPVVGTGRQSYRTLNVGGSVTTQGSIEVDAVDGVTALGDVVIYTAPVGGAQPHLSPWQTAPSRTTDTSYVSGAKHAANVASEWLIPVAALPPGEYVLVGRLYSTSGGIKAYTITARSQIGATVHGPTITELANIDHPTGVFGLWNLCVLNLPVTPVAGAEAQTRLTFVGPSDTTVDELWLFSTDGRLTMIPGVTQPRVLVQAPSLAAPHGDLWLIGSDDDDYYGGGTRANIWQDHDLEPGENNLFVVTSGAVNPNVGARHYDRFHSHPTTAE